ncbi:MAG: SurA N-terminal domain-containing protein [Bacteroidales bacterium]|nr:SurA N-terminal domain-containing protein [Bacteroidales bacterium]
MALIGSIRKHSVLVIIVIGVALAAFVLGDFLRKGPQRPENVVGEVEGEEIKAPEFNKKVEENINMRKQSQGVTSLSEEQRFQIRQSTWNQMVRDVIMSQQYEELGLTVPVEELEDQIMGKNPHQYIVQNFKDPQTGQFSPQMVTNFLQRLDEVDPEMKRRYLLIEEAIKDDRKMKKYNALLTKAYYMPTALAEKDYLDQNQQATYKFFGKRYGDIADTLVKLEESDYEDYYEEHKHEYETEANVDLEYVVFDVKPSKEDRKQIAENVEELFQDFKEFSNPADFVDRTSDKRYDSTWHAKGDLPVRIENKLFNAELGTYVKPFVKNNKHYFAKLLDVQQRPDSMKASHILISYQGTRTAQQQQITRSKERAEKLADSLLQVLKKEPSKLQGLSIQYSDDPSAQRNQGDLGWFEDGAMVYPFNQAVLKNDVGDVVKVESQFGYHIVRVDDKKEPVKKIRVALFERSIEPSSETFQKVYVSASRFAGEADNIEQFEQMVKEQGLNMRSADDVEKMSNNIPGIEYPRQIIRWAFREDTKEGNISQVFDMRETYVVAALENRTEKGIAPLEDVKEKIEPLVQREKKASMIMEDIEEASQASGEINAIANSLELDVNNDTIQFSSNNIPKYGREPKVIGHIFGMEPGITSTPLKGEMAVYMVALDKLIPAEEKEEYSGMKSRLEGSFKARASRSIYQALEEKADIDDNRVFFY